jgi:hypothetical protein
MAGSADMQGRQERLTREILTIFGVGRERDGKRVYIGYLDRFLKGCAYSTIFGEDNSNYRGNIMQRYNLQLRSRGKYPVNASCVSKII